MIKEISQKIKTREDLRENYHEFYNAITCMNVPHMDNKRTKEAIEYCGGEKEYDALVEQLREADTFYGLNQCYKKLDLNFHKVLDGGRIITLDTLDLNIKEDLVLMGLREKEPHLAPKLFDNNVFLASMAVGYHPEVEAHQKKADAMDEKVLEDMLKTEGRGMLDLQIEIFDKPLKVIEGCGPLDNNGNEIGINYVINGKKMLELEEPEMENDMDEISI